MSITRSKFHLSYNPVGGFTVWTADPKRSPRAKLIVTSKRTEAEAPLVTLPTMMEN